MTWRISAGKDNAVCIVKHGNPCGFAIKDTLLNSYVEALKCDPVSAFGGVVAVNYRNKRFNNGFGAKQFIVGTKVFDTRYGENPHQKGALYEFESQFSNKFKVIKGEPSFNNMGDISCPGIVTGKQIGRAHV